MPPARKRRPSISSNPPTLDGNFISLGQFDFAQGTPAAVTISNRDANGYVIIDAVQWIPAGK